MKKYLACVLLLVIVVFVSACSGSEGESTSQGASDNIIENEDIISQSENSNQPNETANDNKGQNIGASTNGTVDYDLTVMSPTMVYAQIYDMMYNYSDYLGKRFKIDGNFQIMPEYSPDGDGYVIIIYDALACCAQGLELRFKEDQQVPEHFSDIVIEGTVNIEIINEGRYIYLEDIKICED